MSLTLELCNDKQKWDGFVESSPQGNPFCAAYFLKGLGVNYDLLFVKRNEDIQVGALVLRHENQLVRTPYPFTMYQGVLFNDSSRNMSCHKRLKWALEVIDFLLAEMEKKYERISFCLHYAIEDLRSFQWFHYHEPNLGQFNINLQYTGLIDLKDFEDFKNYISAIRKTRRYEYRKALNEGFVVETSKDIDELDRLHQLTFERQGLKRNEKTVIVLRNIASSALSNGYGELLLCRDANGKAASATFYLYDKKCGYYLFGANDPAFRDAGSGTFLMLENIKRCYEKGIYRIDVCGINSPNRGDFKTSFNAMPAPYFIVKWERP